MLHRRVFGCLTVIAVAAIIHKFIQWHSTQRDTSSRSMEDGPTIATETNDTLGESEADIIETSEEETDPKTLEQSEDNSDMGPLLDKPEPKKAKRIETLEEYGYHFNKDGKLCKIKTGEPFEFNVRPDDHQYNQRHYEALGKVVDEYVYGLLEKEQLKRVTIPVGARVGAPTGFFYISEGALSKDKLLVLIHGSGVVRAGQWARRLIINNDLDCGTQLPFVKRAIAEDYGVVVMNTNLNEDEHDRPIKGSSSPEEHGSYVWKNFILRAKSRHIAIVAHSYGGVVVGSLAKDFSQDFLARVFAVAFTDSFGYQFGRKSPLHRFFQQCSINWVSSDKPLDDVMTGYGSEFPLRSAGHTKHEWTSWSSFKSIFTFFGERYNMVTGTTDKKSTENVSGQANNNAGDKNDESGLNSNEQEELGELPGGQEVEMVQQDAESDHKDAEVVQKDAEMGHEDAEIGQQDKIGQKDAEVGHQDAEMGQKNAENAEMGHQDAEMGQQDKIGHKDAEIGQQDAEMGQQDAEMGQRSEGKDEEFNQLLDGDDEELVKMAEQMEADQK